jgi:hypothetical protein
VKKRESENLKQNDLQVSMAGEMIQNVVVKVLLHRESFFITFIRNVIKRHFYNLGGTTDVQRGFFQHFQSKKDLNK